jgi:hypothetical protein
MSWIGFDLDHTLAKYESGMAERAEVGEPIPKMVAKAKGYLKAGYEVRIMTARVNRMDGWDWHLQQRVIQAWCIKNIGWALRVTCEKDFEMICLYDDRAVRVEEDTGEILGPDYPVHEGS